MIEIENVSFWVSLECIFEMIMREMNIFIIGFRYFYVFIVFKKLSFEIILLRILLVIFLDYFYFYDFIDEI